MSSDLSKALQEALKTLQDASNVLHEGSKVLQDAVAERSRQPSSELRDRNGILVDRVSALAMAAADLTFVYKINLGTLTTKVSQSIAESIKLSGANFLLAAQNKTLKAEKDELAEKKLNLDAALAKSNAVIAGLEARLDKTKGLAETMEAQLKLEDEQDSEEFDLCQ